MSGNVDKKMYNLQIRHEQVTDQTKYARKAL